MIIVKTEREIGEMRIAGAIVRDMLDLIGEHVRPGVTTRSLNTIAYDYIKKMGAKPSFLGQGGFPATICTSVDCEVVHGIPSNRVLQEGEILKVDAGAVWKGYHGDAARTFAVGEISPEKKRLAEVCKESFFRGIAVLKDGARLGDLGHAIQSYVEGEGYSVVRSLVGHGIGTELHEDPNVPNFGIAGRGTRLAKNMTIAIEPMINMGVKEVEVLDDGWTIVTADGMPSAHYENTVVIGENGVEILTL